MGLDQYLYRRRYVQAWDHQPEHRRPVVTLTIGGRDVPLTNPSYIMEQVMYWRKQNAIHGWFVRNVQGGVDECEPHRVSLDQLKELRDIIVKIMATPKARRDAVAAKLLPTESGFFFGGTEYDDYYYNGLSRTIAAFDEIIASDDDESAYEYQSSW